MDEIKLKQQVAQKIKESSKILVTVSDSPSVDALSAALGLTLLLDKQAKYATAIFSGETPPAIAFLEPEKTFDDSTDSLRDFIIALNKEKADHLRYKVEGDSVKIFITPYKTTIDETDLEYSQGDYNVELVIALGVNDQKSLDAALDNHGQILHDAAIITVTSGEQTSNLGGIDWHDSGASSLSEMIASLSELFKDDKKKSLVDAPIASALLTGIVAETDRFSNERTTPKSMSIASVLMEAGADQQLIATELQNSYEISAEQPESIVEDTTGQTAVVDTTTDDGSMTIQRDVLTIDHSDETLADLDRRVRGEHKAKEKVLEEVEAIQAKAAEEEASEKELLQKPTSGYMLDDTSEEGSGPDYADNETDGKPILGGTLNATSEQAADDARREAESSKNRTILSHSYLGGGDDDKPVTPGSVAVSSVPESEERASEEPAPAAEPLSSLHSAYSFSEEAKGRDGDIQSDPSSIAFGGEKVIQPLNDNIVPDPEASAFETPAVADAMTGVIAGPAAEPAPVFTPAPEPVNFDLPLPPPIPDFSQGGMPSINPGLPAQQPEILGDILTSEQPVNPDNLNAVPAPSSAYAFEPFPADPVATPAVEPAIEPTPVFMPAPEPALVAAPVVSATPADPGQFQIPPQQ